MTSASQPDPVPVIELNPLTIRRAGAEYLVHAGIPGRFLAANGAALEVIERWRGSPQHRPTRPGGTAELQSLIASLTWIGALRSVDGIPIAPPSRSLVERAKALLPRGRTLRHHALCAISKHLPPRMALSLSAELTQRALRSSRALDISAKAMIRERGLTRSLQSDRYVRRHEKAASRQDALVRLAYYASPDTLSRFLTRDVTVDGTQHLADALALGRGAIVVALHAGAFPIIPLWLAATQSDTVMFHYGITTHHVNLGILFDRHKRECAWGNVSIFSSASTSDVKKVVARVRAGAIALVLPDYAPHTNSPNSTHSRAGHAPFEARAPSLRWLGWLVRISQAPVIAADARFPARRGSSYRMTFASLRRQSVLAGDDVGFSTSVRDDLLARYADDPWEWAFLYSVNVA